MPSHFNSRTISSSNSLVLRSRSVSSLRNTIEPPCFFANKKFKTAMRAVPTWQYPVGLGGKRTFTFLSILILRVPPLETGRGQRLKSWGTYRMFYHVYHSVDNRT